MTINAAYHVFVLDHISPSEKHLDRQLLKMVKMTLNWLLVQGDPSLYLKEHFHLIIPITTTCTINKKTVEYEYLWK